MNFKILAAVFALLFIPLFTSAQSLRVIDDLNEEAIEGVMVSGKNSSNFLFTNKDGEIDITELQGEVITFRHLAYQTIQLSREQIASHQGTLRLKPSSITLDEVVLSANRWEQNKKHIPNQIVSIEAKDITHGNPATTADILGQSGQVFIQKSQQGGGSPMLRGFAANSVLIVVDGVRMNNAIFRSGNLHNIISLDPNLLANTEVVLGPGSVIYGSDALGGVMDFHSISPTLSTKGSKKFSGAANMRYATAANEKTGHVHINYGFEKWALLSSISFSDFDDLRTGKKRSSDNSEWGKRIEYVTTLLGEDVIVENDNMNIQKLSGYNQLNLTQKILFQPLKNLNFTYSFHLSKTSNVPRYDRLIEYRNGLPRFAEWSYSPQQWQMHHLKSTYQPNGKFVDQLKATLAFQQVKEGRNDRRFQRAERRERLEIVDIWSLNLDAEKVWKNEKHQLFYGLELTSNQVASTARSVNINSGLVTSTATRYPDGGSTYQSAAIYTSYKLLLNEKSTFTAGLRYNQVSLNASFQDTTFYQFPFSEANVNNGAFNGSIGWVFRPQDSWQINLNLASGFRAPNVDDVGKVFDAEPGTVVVPNPNLKPELAYSGEIGIAKLFGEAFKAELNGFYTYLNNAMVRRPFLFSGQDSILYDGTLSQVQALVNTGKAYTTGVSLLVKAEFGKSFTSTATATFTEGRDTQEDLPLRHVPPLFGRWSLDYEKDKLRLSGDVQFAGRKWLSNMSPSEQNKIHIYTPTGTPSWYTLNIRATYQLNDYLTLQTGMENILDKHYRPYSSGISAPGRNIYFSARARW